MCGGTQPISVRGQRNTFSNCNNAMCRRTSDAAAISSVIYIDGRRLVICCVVITLFLAILSTLR